MPAPDSGDDSVRLCGPCEWFGMMVGLANDLIGVDTVITQQDDLSPPDMLVWCVAIPSEHLQTAVIGGPQSKKCRNRRGRRNARCARGARFYGSEKGIMQTAKSQGGWRCGTCSSTATAT